MAKKWACFVDRDGTLIRDVGYLSRVDQIEVLPRVGEGIRLLQSLRLMVVMVTNQSAVARGYINEGELHEIHREIASRLAADGAVLNGIYYCPHHPTEGHPPYRVLCQCRKPDTGLIERACIELGLEARGSYVIGDQIIDMELARRVGAKGLLVGTPPAEAIDRPPADPGADAIWKRATDFWDAAQLISRDVGPAASWP